MEEQCDCDLQSFCPLIPKINCLTLLDPPRRGLSREEDGTPIRGLSRFSGRHSLRSQLLSP